MHKIFDPRKRDTPLLKDIITGVSLLTIFITAAVYIGMKIGELKISAWGDWLGASVGTLALIGSIYAIILQSRGSEATNWNIASIRLGEQYSFAQKDEKLSSLILESPDNLNKNLLTYKDISLKPQEKVFFNNLLLSYEQIFIASKSLSGESKRVWRIYLYNQLNKPSLRAYFVKDSFDAKDFHQEFYEFVRGKKKKKPKKINSDIGEIIIDRKDFVIHPIHYENYAKTKNIEKTNNQPNTIKISPFNKSDLTFWKEIYGDIEVKKNMYALPTDNDSVFSNYLIEKNYFTAWIDETRVGGFNLKPDSNSIVDIGIVVSNNYRNNSIGHLILEKAEEVALNKGFKTLRANIFSDNYAAKKIFTRKGYRRFDWFEKNFN